MPQSSLTDVLDHLRRIWGAQAARDRPDGELLERFLSDNDQAAFSALVHRHGPMVLAVGRRLLGDVHAAEDVLQATFLVLVRRAGSIWKHKPLAGWLYRVAQRIAFRTRAQAAARRNLERRSEPMPRSEPLDDLTWQELRSVLDEEIGALPEKYRAPVVLCHLQGLSYDQAAQQLGWRKSSLAKRLTKARELLRRRLVRRGITLTAGTLATVLSEKISGAPLGALLAIKTVKAAMSYTAGKTVAGGCASAAAIVMAEQAIKTMLGTGAKLAILLLALSSAVAGVGVAVYGAWLQQVPSAKNDPVQAPAAKADAPGPARQKAAAVVDAFGDTIPHGALARLGTVRFRPAGAIDLAFAPDGQTLASGGGLMSGVCLWDVESGRRLYRVGVNPRAIAVAFSPDGKTLFNGGNFGFLEAATGKLVRQVEEPPLEPGNFRVAFSPDGKMVVGGGSFRMGKTWDRAVIVWDAATGKELRRWSAGQQASISKLAFSPDSKSLAVASYGDTMRLWDVATGKEVRRFDHGKAVRSVAFAPSGKMVATVGDDAGLRLWNADTGELTRWLKDGAEGFSTLTFSKDGKLLAAGGLSGMLRLWDPQTGKELRHWQANSGAMYSIAFSHNGKWLASVGAMGHNSIRIWETDTGNELHSSNVHTNAPHSLSFSADGKTLFSCSQDQRAVEWDLTTGRKRDRLFAGPLGPPVGGYGAAANGLSPDGTFLAQEATHVDAQFHSAIRLWDTISGKELRTFGKVSLVRSLTFSPDGKLLASGSAGGRRQPDGTGGIRLWDPATGKEVTQFETRNLDVVSIAFSGSGKLLASTDFDESKILRPGAGTIRLWDTATGKELRRWEDNAFGVSCTISPDGKYIASADRDIVRILATDTGKELLRLRHLSPSDFAVRLAFSPSGRMLSVAGSNASLTPSTTALPDKKMDGSCAIHLWDALSGQEIRRIEVPPHSYVTAMAFTPDGRTLATGGGDSAILLWDVTAPPKDGKSKPGQLSADELNVLWSDLASDAVKADQAIWTLARAPKQGGPFLQDRLRLTPITAEQLAKLIADLDSNQFAIRQQAAKTLEELGDSARPALRKAVATPIPLEVRQRIEVILTQGDKEVIRTLRAVEALEHIGTAEARQALQGMNQRDPRVAEAAEAALKRLGNRGR